LFEKSMILLLSTSWGCSASPVTSGRTDSSGPASSGSAEATAGPAASPPVTPLVFSLTGRVKWWLPGWLGLWAARRRRRGRGRAVSDAAGGGRLLLLLPGEPPLAAQPGRATCLKTSSTGRLLPGGRLMTKRYPPPASWDSRALPRAPDGLAPSPPLILQARRQVSTRHPQQHASPRAERERRRCCWVWLRQGTAVAVYGCGGVRLHCRSPPPLWLPVPARRDFAAQPRHPLAAQRALLAIGPNLHHGAGGKAGALPHLPANHP